MNNKLIHKKAEELKLKAKEYIIDTLEELELEEMTCVLNLCIDIRSTHAKDDSEGVL